MTKTKLLVLTVLTMLVAACSPKEDVKPRDIAQDISGTYQVYKVTYNSQTVNLPSNGLSIGLVINKTGLNTVWMKINTTNNGTQQSSTVSLEAKELPNDRIGLYEDSKEVGTVVGKDLTMNVVTDDGNRMILVAQK